MASLKPGDRVICRIQNAKIVSAYSTFDEVRTFEIIAVEDSGYFLYVPEYYNIGNSVEITDVSCKKLGLPKKYVGTYTTYILETQIERVHFILDGCICVECGEFYDMAEPNQENGTLICFSCRSYPIYASSADDDY